MRSRKLLKKKSKRILTMEKRYGVEETAAMIHEWTSKAGSVKGSQKGFAKSRELASEAGKKGAEVARQNRASRA